MSTVQMCVQSMQQQQHSLALAFASMLLHAILPCRCTQLADVQDLQASVCGVMAYI